MNPYNYLLSTHKKDQITSSLNLVRESFGDDVDIAYEEYYEWQYLKNPLGKGNVLLVYDGSKAIGQIASVPCLFRIHGKDVPALSIMNLSVSSQYQGKGIMGQLVSRILETEDPVFATVIPNGAAINGYLKKGFHPMPMAFMIKPVRLSTYFYNRRLAAWSLKPFDILWKKKKRADKVDVQEYLPMFDKRFDDLITAADDDRTIRQVRDSKLLNWRYKLNPRRKYRTLTATGRDGRLQGYIIIRTTELFGKSTGLIIDLVTIENPEVGRSLIVSALEYFWTKGVALAMAVCFPKRMEYKLLGKEGFFVCPRRLRPHPLTLCVRVLTGEQLKDRLIDPGNWSFMFGDYETF